MARTRRVHRQSVHILIVEENAMNKQKYSGKATKNADAVEVYLFIGGPNSGKSTVVAALTGARQIQIRWEVLYHINSNTVKIFIHPRSLQEYPKKPEDFINEVAACGATKVFVALRECGVGQGLVYPSGANPTLGARA